MSETTEDSSVRRRVRYIPHKFFGAFKLKIYAGLDENGQEVYENLITPGLKLYKTDGYIAKGDYETADLYLKSLKIDKGLGERVLIKTQSLAIHRGDLDRFLTISEELLNKYVSDNNFIDYANELGNRAAVLNFPFNLQQKSKNVLNELEKMLNGPNKKLDFVDMSLFVRRGIIQTYQSL